MRRRIFRWAILILIVVAAGGAIWHYTRPDPVAVRVKPVGRGIVERTVANTRAGTVKACRRAKLSPSIGGQIAKLTIREGDTVKAGDLLLEIWNQDLVAEVQLAESEAEAARARAKAACLKAEVAQREANRLVKLHENRRRFGRKDRQSRDRSQSPQGGLQRSKGIRPYEPGPYRRRSKPTWTVPALSPLLTGLLRKSTES